MGLCNFKNIRMVIAEPVEDIRFGLRSALTVAGFEQIEDRRSTMPIFKALVVVALLGGLAISINLTADKPTSETPMMLNTPVATL